MRRKVDYLFNCVIIGRLLYSRSNSRSSFSGGNFKESPCRRASDPLIESITMFDLHTYRWLSEKWKVISQNDKRAYTGLGLEIVQYSYQSIPFFSFIISVFNKQLFSTC